MSESEREILKFTKVCAKTLGLYCLRVSMRPGVEVGWPDILVFGPGQVLGMETKRPGKSATKMQVFRGETLRAYGFMWVKCDSKADVKFTLTNFARHCAGDRLLSRVEFDAQEMG